MTNKLMQVRILAEVIPRITGLSIKEIVRVIMFNAIKF